uniref:Meiotic fizzy-related protein 1 n=1 Tax=Cacopsylla melanoneura TaxID=428564 RepID=A0A8D9F9N2_9HEMI
MSWNDNLLSCGSIDGTILHFDLRATSGTPCAKTQEEDTVCGLAWSPNLTYLASGSNNTVKVSYYSINQSIRYLADFNVFFFFYNYGLTSKYENLTSQIQSL